MLSHLFILIYKIKLFYKNCSIILISSKDAYYYNYYYLYIDILEYNGLEFSYIYYGNPKLYMLG